MGSKMDNISADKVNQLIEEFLRINCCSDDLNEHISTRLFLQKREYPQAILEYKGVFKEAERSCLHEKDRFNIH